LAYDFHYRWAALETDEMSATMPNPIAATDPFTCVPIECCDPYTENLIARFDSLEATAACVDSARRRVRHPAHHS